MARINLTHHRKFRQLARALGSRAVALGTLELLWLAAYEAADPYVGGAEDVAEAVGWAGDPGELADLLVTLEWLEPVPARGADAYAVHDLWDHAPKYVRLRWTRAHPGELPRPWHKDAIPAPEPLDAGAGSCVPQTGTYPPRPAPSHDQEKEQRRGRRGPGAYPVENDLNPRVLVRLAYELADLEDEADKKDELKRLAARYHVGYDAGSITRALDHIRGRPLWVRTATREGAAPARRIVKGFAK